MPDIRIVLVEPLYEGNIGFTARVMKNFGFKDLVLIDPCPIGDEAYARASHAGDILSTATICSFDELVSTGHILIATTGEVSKSVCHSMRMPYFVPREIREMVHDLDGTISILFGRENWGLNNNEVQQCDLICTVPASSEYPILNLSHAVGIICYELAGMGRGEYPVAARKEMDHLYHHIEQYLDLINHPIHKRLMTMVLIRRVLGRSQLTVREASTLHGLLRRSEWHINPDLDQFRRRDDKLISTDSERCME